MSASTRATTAESTAASTNVPAYRTDLDGLRGIAIALVACFHIWFGKVSGGVDVFLTLSGYFFVGSLLRHAIHSQKPHVTYWDTLNPWPRLSRLLRRLLPALITILVGVVVLTVVVLPQTRWANVGREVVASALYYQNWYLARNSQDYLAASSANSPLQHIWSMSVQGQFFLLTLLVALGFAFALKLGSRILSPLADPRVIKFLVGGAVLFVAAVSFYWAHRGMALNQPFNYYDTRSRLWEPLAGGLIAIWMPSWRVPRWLRNIVAGSALLLIISCGWWIDGVAEYPGPMALVPVLATLAIIWSGATALEKPRKGSVGDQSLPLINRALSHRYPVWLGSIAYALYLIHWPLLIFYLVWRGKNGAGFIEGTVLLAISVGLAWLMKRYIEDPLRAGRSAPSHAIAHRRWLSYASVVTTVLVVATIATGTAIKVWERHVANTVVDTSNLDPNLYPGGRALLHGLPVPALDPQPSPLEVLTDFPETSTDGFMSNFEDPDIYVGEYGDPTAQRTVALVGGSHAEMWVSALHRIGQANGFKVKTYLKMGCPLSTDPEPIQLGKPYPQCYEWGQRVVQEVLELNPDAVFTNSGRPIPNGPGDHVPDDYLPIFDTFLDAGIPILGIRDTPWPANPGGATDTPTCLADGGNGRTCGTPRYLALSEEDPAIAVAATRELFFPLDLSEAVCDDELCPAVVGNIIVYKDWHHLSKTFVWSVTDELARQMAQALPWTGPEVP